MQQKHFYTFIFALLMGLGSNAQTTVDQISTGLGYGKAAFYKLSDGSSTQLSYDYWDLAFTNFDLQSAGVFINEATNSSMGQAGPEMAAYDPLIFNFDQPIDPSELTDENRIYNPESSWREGAFNTMRDTTNPFDYGWGAYNPGQHKVIGERVFGLKLRNGQYRKLIIDEFDGTTYKFRIANLDGSNLNEYTVVRTPDNGSPVKYFSFASPTPPEPAGWDLTFCRYDSPLWDGTGYIPYAVTGILTNNGLLTAKAIGVDPATVDYHPYLDSLSSRLDVIGHDWKYFTGTMWTIIADRAYFVEQANGNLYKLVFTNFSGSASGTATIERTFITQLSSAAELPEFVSEIAVFPNPCAEQMSIALNSKSDSKANIRLLDLNGRSVYEGKSQVQQGLNVLEINNLNKMQSGHYILVLEFPEGNIARPVQIR